MKKIILITSIMLMFAISSTAQFPKKPLRPVTDVIGKWQAIHNDTIYTLEITSERYISDFFTSGYSHLLHFRMLSQIERFDEATGENILITIRDIKNAERNYSNVGSMIGSNVVYFRTKDYKLLAKRGVHFRVNGDTGIWEMFKDPQDEYWSDMISLGVQFNPHSKPDIPENLTFTKIESYEDDSGVTPIEPAIRPGTGGLKGTTDITTDPPGGVRP